MFVLLSSYSFACSDEDFVDAVKLSIGTQNDEDFDFIVAKLKECPDFLPLRKLKARILYKKEMYKETLEEMNRVLSIDPFDEEFLLFRCIINEGLDYQNSNKDAHLLCFKNVSEIIKENAIRENKKIIEIRGSAYVIAVSMAELPEAEEVRRQYLMFLDKLIAEESHVEDEFYTMIKSFERDIIVNFDRNNFYGINQRLGDGI
jgi:tetratricopeptide (TPR) repeat protein